MRDSDSGEMSVLVNMDQNDRLLAMEFVFWENEGVALDWSTLTIVTEPPLLVSECHLVARPGAIETLSYAPAFDMLEFACFSSLVGP